MISSTPGPIRPRARPIEFVSEALQVAAKLACNLGNRGRHIARSEYRGSAGSEDAGLLATDRFAIPPEPFAVVQVDRRHQRRVGIDDVDRVEAPAQSDL